jgi:hypothetical protein
MDTNKRGFFMGILQKLGLTLLGVLALKMA